MSINTAELRNDDLEQYADYVRKIAHQLIRDFDFPKQYFDDFFSDGYIGLIEAYERFDPEEGTPFKQYAFYRVRGAILDGARKISEISPRTYRFLKSYQALSDIREHELARQLGGAGKVKTKKDSLAMVLDYLHKGGLLFRLSTEAKGEDPEWLPTENLNPGEHFDKSEQSSFLRNLLEELPEKSKTIIEEYYFKDKPFIQISEEMGLSKSWISRMHRTALDQLRDLYIEHSEEEA